MLVSQTRHYSIARNNVSPLLIEDSESLRRISNMAAKVQIQEQMSNIGSGELRIRHLRLE